MITDPRRRRIARNLARAATVVSGFLFAFTLVSSLAAGGADAATNGGAATIVVANGATGGGSATTFQLRLPTGAACTGDTATQGYRLNSYLVPSTVDPATLQWDSFGPTPSGSGANLRRALNSSTGQPFVNQFTAPTDTANGPGLVTGLPSFSWSKLTTTIMPAGSYNLGIACTLGGASPTQLDKYWNAQITVTADGSDVPGGFTWVAGGATPTPTTTPTTTATTSATTSASTTASPGASSTSTAATTTTAVRTSSSTAAAASSNTATTTTAVATATSGATASTTTVVAAAAPGSSSGGNLAESGGQPVPLVVWAALCLIFGRMAILLGRPPRVVSAGRA